MVWSSSKKSKSIRIGTDVPEKTAPLLCDLRSITSASFILLENPRVRRSAPRRAAWLLRTHLARHQVLNSILFYDLAERFSMHSSLTINCGQCAANPPTLTSDEHHRRA